LSADFAPAAQFAAKGGKRYRYYTCTNAIKKGRGACSSGSLPAAEIEQVVVDEIRCIGQDAELLAEARANVSASAALHPGADAAMMSSSILCGPPGAV